MNTGAIKLRGSNASFGRFFVSVLTLFFVLSTAAFAASSNAQFETYIFNICSTPGLGPTVSTMCANAFPGGPFGSYGTVNVSTNLGIANADNGAALRKKKGIRELRDEQKNQPEKGASADGRGWGFLLTPQYGNSTRTETDLENGYQSNLKGLVAGLDYRFSDSFVLGATLGQTKDDATFFNSAGSLKTSNNTFNLYGTWVASENTSVDGYLGYGKLSFDSQRQVVFGPIIFGMASGSTTGQQFMAGMSASYQKDIGRFNLSPFINLDYIKTSITGYSESGTTLMELRYSDRSTVSFTSSLGARVSSTYGYDWGTLQPSMRLVAVHEFQNNAKQIYNELVITPGIGLLVSTDAPDRNYLNIGLGVSAALNGGTQLFLDYDRRAQDRLLSSWAVSAGVLVGY
jgi:uncharacterized protein YhjY with autotransporter beta-barrel domain